MIFKNAALYRFLFLTGSLFFLSLGSVRCTTSKGPSNATSPVAQWAGSMQGMARDLENLLPYVFSREEFSDVDNRKRIQKLIERFEAGVEVVPQHAGEAVLGKDPLIQYSLRRLVANTRYAAQSFREGHVEFARNLLRENMGFCFSCHTTQNIGPQTGFSTLTLATGFRMHPSERANFYVATRQYDKAKDVLMTVLRPDSAVDDPREQVEALRKYLSLEVRVKSDPVQAATVVESYLSNQKIPRFIAADAKVWLASLKSWAREFKTYAPTLSNGRALLAKAKRMQSSRGYQAGLVDHLRATSVLHEALRDVKKPASRAEIYELLGQGYEALFEMGVWELPQAYYEACVRTLPKSELAMRCYTHLERALVIDYSGSGGVFLPREERERLIELKALSGL